MRGWPGIRLKTSYLLQLQLEILNLRPRLLLKNLRPRRLRLRHRLSRRSEKGFDMATIRGGNKFEKG
jgi:hypothetical protein